MTNRFDRRSIRGLFILAGMAVVNQASAQNPPASPPVADTVRAILPPKSPLPSEAASAGVERFSFIVYGDTRGRRDGVDPQYEHSLVVDEMLRRIRAARSGQFPVKFVLQSGDAVVNGRDPRQWNMSFVGLINRLTQEGDVPYFLAPGNHDVTGSPDLASPARAEGLRNYLRANASLIPPTGASRRLDGYPTYAFGYGNTFVLGFDSNIADDSTQLRWVDSQLAGLDRRRYKHIVAFFHHPPLSSGPHGGAIVEAPTAAVRARYMPLFRKHGVTLLVTGHEHLYEHWVERYRDQTGRLRRMDQIVTGGGGAPIYPHSGEPDLQLYSRTSATPADSVRVQHLVRPGADRGENPYHFAVVTVDGDRLSLTVLGVDWGASFAPYRSNRAALFDTTTTRRD